MLLYWQYCDQNRGQNAPVIASEYYKTLRNLEDGKCIHACMGLLVMLLMNDLLSNFFDCGIS